MGNDRPGKTHVLEGGASAQRRRCRNPRYGGVAKRPVTLL